MEDLGQTKHILFGVNYKAEQQGWYVEKRKQTGPEQVQRVRMQRGDTGAVLGDNFH